MNRTLEYYDKNAENFVRNTVAVDLTAVRDRFLNHLAAGAKILDFGCGSGRDAACFHSRGFAVDAVDGSAQLCRLAGRHTGIMVKQMLFSELNVLEMYDGIWACASILHLPQPELRDVMGKMHRALKAEGWIYTSFKYGTFEGNRNGRYFTDFTEDAFEAFLADMDGIRIEEFWISGDARPGREDEKWLNLILHKSNTR